ncbi:hypothetical protein II906_03285 [bacterium]|nr:hypothetical protein [bacterium]
MEISSISSTNANYNNYQSFKAKQKAKFIDSATNKAVEDVTIKNGHASNIDGSDFNGTMQCRNKKGEKVSIEYKDGAMSEAIVEGRVKKSYKYGTKHDDSYKSNWESWGKPEIPLHWERIKTYDKHNNVIGYTYNVYKNGKLKSTNNAFEGGIGFYEDGKVKQKWLNIGNPIMRSLEGFAYINYDRNGNVDYISLPFGPRDLVTEPNKETTKKYEAAFAEFKKKNGEFLRKSVQEYLEYLA